MLTNSFIMINNDKQSSFNELLEKDGSVSIHMDEEYSYKSQLERGQRVFITLAQIWDILPDD